MAVAGVWVVWLALVVVQLGFGAYGVVVSKFAKENQADPLIFSLIRDAGCFPVLLIAAYVAEKTIQVPSLRELPLFIVLGLTGMFGNQLLYLLGIYYTNANIASIFQPAIPVWTALLAIIARIEPFPDFRTLRGWAKCLGILLAAVGAVVMTVQKNTGAAVDHGGSSDADDIQFWGYIFLLGNTLSMAIYVLLQKKFIFDKEESAWKTKPVTVTAWSYMFGAIFMALASLYYVNKPEKFTYFPKEEIYPILYAIFIASGLCYLLISWCNMQISASLVTATWPLQVLFCAILSYFVLGEVLNTLEIFGGLFIVVGLMVVVWSNFAEERRREEEDELTHDSYGYVKVSQYDTFVPEVPQAEQKSVN